MYLAAAVLMLGACSRWPDSYPVPEQRKPPMKVSITMVSMDDPEADDYIVKDVAPAAKGLAWRWSYDRPEVAVSVKHTANLRAAADFSIVPDTLRATGPVTVTLFVNGRAAVSKRYPAVGDYRLEAAVPEGAIPGPGVVHVAAEARPLWVAPADGKHLGIVLIRIGLL